MILLGITEEEGCILDFEGQADLCGGKGEAFFGVLSFGDSYSVEEHGSSLLPL